MATLSKRGARNVDIYVGHLPVTLTEVVDDSNWIDLSFAENYAVRKEVLEIFREVAGTQVTEKVGQSNDTPPCGDPTNIAIRISTGRTGSGVKQNCSQPSLRYLTLILLHSSQWKTVILF